MMLTEALVREALADVPYPGLRSDIVKLGLVRSIAVHNDRVHVSLTLSTEREDVPGLLRDAITARLAQAGAVRTEIQLLTPERKPVERDPWARQGRLPGARLGGEGRGGEKHRRGEPGARCRSRGSRSGSSTPTSTVPRSRCCWGSRTARPARG